MSIEEYSHFGLKGRKIAERLMRGHETVYRILRQLKRGLIPFEIHLQYQVNKGNCRRKKIKLSDSEVRYINEKVQKDLTLDIIIGHKKKPISGSMHALYRKFESGESNQNDLPMQGKRKLDGHQEKGNKRSSIRNQYSDYPNYQKEFGHLEGDTIIGHQHKSAIIALIESAGVCISALKPNCGKAADIEKSLNQWLSIIIINESK